MATTVQVQVTVDEAAIREIARGPDTHAFVLRCVEDAAAQLRAGSPVRTGAGRASIRGRAEMGPDGWYGTASWDTAHYYMGIQDARRHFVGAALSRTRFV